MLFLWILAGLPLLVLLLLAMQVRVRVECRNGWWQVRARYGPVWYTANPELLGQRREKAAARAAKKKEKQKPEATPKKDAGKDTPPKKKKADSRELFGIGWQLLRSVRAAMALVCRHFIIDKLRIVLAVGGEDAHKTALAYARVTAALTLVLEILDELFVLRAPKVGAVPDFTKPGVRYDISATLRFRPIVVAAAAILVLFRLLRLLLDRRKHKKTTRKAGAAVPENA